MIYPPERITVKRRRDEDPVEALFIQQKKQRPSGFWKLVDNLNDTPQYAVPTAFPIATKETTTTTAASAAYLSPKVPTVRTTLPNDDFNEPKNATTHSSKNKVPSNCVSSTIQKRQLPSGIPQPKQPRQNLQDVFASASKARRFHLLTSPSPISSPFLIPKTIAQKHRDKRRKDLAVFTERPALTRGGKTLHNDPSLSSGEPRQENHDEIRCTLQLERPHKRPNATAAELKWRTETWDNRTEQNEVNEHRTKTAENINEPSNQWNYESARLAEQLQKVALEEIRVDEERTKELKSTGKLKFKPKPPKPRQSGTNNLDADGSEGATVKDIINLDHDSDYVIDTYVRSSEQPFEATAPTNLHQASLHDINHGSIGILIIEDEDEEALWDAFAEDPESDPGWNSEEEDENAEDYYGNDYPEDEVNSDDEFSRCAYDYRHASSDIEEFDLSDEE